MFDHKQKMCECDVSLSASYMEIYRDEVYDLLVDRETVGHAFAVYSWQYVLKES
jgi:hypothetical protein